MSLYLVFDHYLYYTKELPYQQMIPTTNMLQQSHDEPLRKYANALSVSLSYITKASSTLFDENPISCRRVYPLTNS